MVLYVALHGFNLITGVTYILLGSKIEGTKPNVNICWRKLFAVW